MLSRNAEGKVPTREAAAWRCGSPDPDLRARETDRRTCSFVFPSTKGEESRGSLGCVGTGANKDLGEPIGHGRGLAQRAQWQRQSESSRQAIPPHLAQARRLAKANPRP